MKNLHKPSPNILQPEKAFHLNIAVHNCLYGSENPKLKKTNSSQSTPVLQNNVQQQPW